MGARLEIEAGRAQAFYHLPVFLIGEPSSNALCDHLADVLGACEFVFGSASDCVQVRECSSERFGDASPNMQDAQPKDQSPQLAAFARFECLKKILSGLLSHALELQQVRNFECVKVGDIANQIRADELCNQHLAAAFDIHRATRAPTLDSATYLCRALV